MTKCLLAKEKYKFVDALKNAVDVPTVLLSELTDIVGAYIRTTYQTGETTL